MKAESAVLTQWAYARVGQTLVLCTQGYSGPPESDLDGWIARVAQRDYSRILAHSLGGAPSTRQRAKLAAFWKTKADGAPPFALLTDSLAVRAALTAYFWLTNEHHQQAFACKELERALRWLGETAPVDLFERTIADLHAAIDNRS